MIISGVHFYGHPYHVCAYSPQHSELVHVAECIFYAVQLINDTDYNKKMIV